MRAAAPRRRERERRQPPPSLRDRSHGGSGGSGGGFLAVAAAAAAAGSRRQAALMSCDCAAVGWATGGRPAARHTAPSRAACYQTRVTQQCGGDSVQHRSAEGRGRGRLVWQEGQCGRGAAGAEFSALSGRGWPQPPERAQAPRPRRRRRMRVPAARQPPAAAQAAQQYGCSLPRRLAGSAVQAAAARQGPRRRRCGPLSGTGAAVWQPLAAVRDAQRYRCCSVPVTSHASGASAA